VELKWDQNRKAKFGNPINEFYSPFALYHASFLTLFLSDTPPFICIKEIKRPKNMKIQNWLQINESDAKLVQSILSSIQTLHRKLQVLRTGYLLFSPKTKMYNKI